jgi:hypothetical protein
MQTKTKGRIKGFCAALFFSFLIAGWSWGFYMASILYGKARYEQGVRTAIGFCNSQKTLSPPIQASYGYEELE